MAIDNYTPEQIEEILQAFFEVAGTRQYIGARYVPIFGRGRGTPIEWDNSDAYEPLSIVYYQGDTYTSRRYVPAGIAIDNQDYWVITGRYNAQVEQYRQEVLGFSDRINGAYDAVETLRNEVADDYVPFPDAVHYPKYGTLGQVLTTLADGETKWEDPVVPSDAQAEEVITAWLDDHPEATTTVQDGAITTAKLADGAVTDAKLAQSGGILDSVSSLWDELYLGLDKLGNNYSIVTRPEIELGTINSDTGETEASTTDARNATFIAKDDVLSFIVNPHTGALYVYRYEYENGTYTYLGRNQRTSTGDFTNWFKNLTATHVKFVMHNTVSAMEQALQFLYSSNLSSDITTLIDSDSYNSGMLDNIGYWRNKLTVAAGSTHSAQLDKIPVNIKQGSTYSITINSNVHYIPQIYAYYSDGTGERVVNGGAGTIVSTTVTREANADIVAFGAYASGTSYPERVFEFIFETKDTLADDATKLPRLTESFIRTPNGLMCFERGRARQLIQSIAVLDDQVWEFDEGHAYYDGTTYALDNGHGNNCNWGVTLHGTYPYLYCPTWINNQNKINVFSFDGSTFTLESTINIAAYSSGHMDAYIDEQAGYIYSFNYASNRTGSGMSYAVSDMTGATIFTKTIPNYIPIVQGLCFHDDVIYMVSGFGDSEFPNYLNIIATDGTVLGRYPIAGIGEIEGIDFLDNKMVLASYYYFYINPVTVPETRYVGSTSQLVG